MNEGVVSMGARVEVTQRLRQAYRSASKAEKSLVLDRFCEATGLSRSSARRYLTSPVIGQDRVVRLDGRSRRPRKYSPASRAVLVRIWMMMGCPCGKYMASQMGSWIASLKAHGELVEGSGGFSASMEAELVAMSGATIDRYLAEEKKRMELKGISATRSGALLRQSITIRKAGDQAEGEPGFFEMDTVAHCGPTLRGEFARTLTLTDVHTGWVHLEVMRNNARVHVLAALERAVEAIPFRVSGLDCDNGSEFLNHDVITWAGGRDIYFTRSRPYRKNDQAHVESKNNHVVRRFGFHYRYDTPEQRQLLAQLWERVCLRLNFFTATRKPIGWASDASGRRKRLYDAPATPLERLLAAGVISPAQQAQLQALKAALNPAELTRDILRIQDLLIASAKAPTQALIDAEELRRTRQTKRLQGGIRQSA